MQLAITQPFEIAVHWLPVVLTLSLRIWRGVQRRVSVKIFKLRFAVKTFFSCLGEC
jgi:hypothetical protein